MENTKKILMVDDDIDVITAVETILLKKEGYKIMSANDKTEGLAKAIEIKPDVAILDVMMETQYEGFELAKEIAEHEELKGTKILIQSSIDVLTTSNPSIQAMARDYRNNPENKDLQVILIKNLHEGTAGIDYRSANGETVWVPVNGFLHKPVDPQKITAELEKLLK